MAKILYLRTREALTRPSGGLDGEGNQGDMFRAENHRIIRQDGGWMLESLEPNMVEDGKRDGWKLREGSSSKWLPDAMVREVCFEKVTALDVERDLAKHRKPTEKP